ncbi:hypothetical protein, partial [Klebsiella pneumoniae]|uniref:hypothetical protein n=1 Tax=Klebsiella pneumoniae TaxID=573 RepID=UPI0039C18D21
KTNYLVVITYNDGEMHTVEYFKNFSVMRDFVNDNKGWESVGDIHIYTHQPDNTWKHHETVEGY